jgi:hypothetical protein
MHGLSGWPGRAGRVHVAVTVSVMTVDTLVDDKDVLVMTLVDVVVIGTGVIVFVFFAVPLGSVTVESGPVVMTFVKVVVMVRVSTGVDVKLKVTVGVKVLVTGVPTVK